MQHMILILLPLVWTCTDSTKLSNQASELKTTREKFSYSLGYDFGPAMENIKSGVDLELFMRGLEDYLNGHPYYRDRFAVLDFNRRQRAPSRPG